MIKLVIFDVDGTLARAFTSKILPRVKEFFQVLRSECPQVPRVAIATNQGGVGMRYWMEKESFGNPEKYPTIGEIEQRLKEILAALGGDSEIPFYVSYRYRTKECNWTPVPPGEAENPRWDSTWRKPNPGMLLQAMEDSGVGPGETVYIGDSPEDQAAAQSAGCLFMQAEEFFQKDWADCQSLEENFLKPT